MYIAINIIRLLMEVEKRPLFYTFTHNSIVEME